MARQVLNDLVSIELPEVGRSLARGEAFGSIESAKAATELTAPMSGEVVAVNTDLREQLGRLAADPHGTWIIKLKLKDLTEAATLLSSTQFDELVKPAEAPRRRAPKPPRPPKPAPVKPTPAPDPVRIDPDKALALLWSVRLRDRRLKGGDDAFGDRDYSGGSDFSWRQREIAFTADAIPAGGMNRRYFWRDTRWTRVSVPGLSNTTSTHTDYSGSWNVEVIGGSPYLVLQDRERGRLSFRLGEGPRGEVLLDGKAYSSS